MDGEDLPTKFISAHQKFLTDHHWSLEFHVVYPNPLLSQVPKFKPKARLLYAVNFPELKPP